MLLIFQKLHFLSLEAVANAADKKEAPAAEEGFSHYFYGCSFVFVWATYPQEKAHISLPLIVDTVDSLAKRVKTLKAKKAPKEEIEAAVKLLLAAKEKQAEKLAVDRVFAHAYPKALWALLASTARFSMCTKYDLYRHHLLM